MCIFVYILLLKIYESISTHGNFLPILHVHFEKISYYFYNFTCLLFSMIKFSYIVYVIGTNAEQFTQRCRT